jgi:glycerol-3-phosphate acyltransferase PlsY
LTLLLDALKGWLPVAMVLAYGPEFGLGPQVAALAGLAAFLGHLYPVFFGFAGGKGVATAVGVVMGVHGLLALATVLTFAIVVFFSRYVSLASMVAAVFAPVFYLFGDGVAWQASATEVLSLAIMALLLVWRHRENINRLLAGTESQLGKKKA